MQARYTTSFCTKVSFDPGFDLGSWLYPKAKKVSFLNPSDLECIGPNLSWITNLAWQYKHMQLSKAEGTVMKSLDFGDLQKKNSVVPLRQGEPSKESENNFTRMVTSHGGDQKHKEEAANCAKVKTFSFHFQNNG